MKRRILTALMVVLLILIAMAVYFVQFMPVGYRMTVPLRGFIKVAPNVYVHDAYPDLEAVTAIASDARARVEAFYGTLRSVPVLIVCDDPQTLANLGGDHDTMTVALLDVHSYIVVSSKYLDVDIVAHEFTHAETHERLYKGKLGYTPLVPTWFDEGVALQNDDRAQYNEGAWNRATKVVALSDIDTAEEFYLGTVEARRNNYVISRHEVRAWLERNDSDTLISLLDAINRGARFEELMKDV